MSSRGRKLSWYELIFNPRDRDRGRERDREKETEMLLKEVSLQTQQRQQDRHTINAMIPPAREALRDKRQVMVITLLDHKCFNAQETQGLQKDLHLLVTTVGIASIVQSAALCFGAVEERAIQIKKERTSTKTSLHFVPVIKPSRAIKLLTTIAIIVIAILCIYSCETKKKTNSCHHEKT